jgi:hypothetical protein
MGHYDEMGKRTVLDPRVLCGQIINLLFLKTFHCEGFAG